MDRLAVVSRHIGRPEAPLPAASADRSNDAMGRKLAPATYAAARTQRPAAPVPRREAQQQRPLLRRSPSTPSHAAGRLHSYRRYGRTFPAAGADTQQEVRLYGAEYSVYTRIARLVLEECGVSYSLLEVDIFGAEDELPADYLRRHPFREQHRPSACSLSP